MLLEIFNSIYLVNGSTVKNSWEPSRKGGPKALSAPWTIVYVMRVTCFRWPETCVRSLKVVCQLCTVKL